MKLADGVGLSGLGCWTASKTRIVYYFAGLAQTMPLFSSLLLVLTMANISLPVLSPTFAAELLIFTGVFLANKFVAISFEKGVGLPEL